MGPVILTILTPTVIAAAVSALAVFARDLLGRRSLRETAAVEKARVEGDLAARGQEMLLRQVEALWRENAAGKALEAECRQRCRDLERQCQQLAAEVDRLRRRLDDLTLRLPADTVVIQPTGESA